MSSLTRMIESVALCGGVVAGISYYENRQIRLEEYRIASGCLPEVFDQTKLVFLSDLHNRCFGTDQEELMKIIDVIGPDMILVGGDMVVGKPGMTTQTAYHLLSQLAKKYSVVAADGNHEYRMKIYTDTYGKQYEEYVAALRVCKVSYLSNQTIKICKKGSSIWITGLSIEREYYRRGSKTEMDPDYLNRTIGKKERGRFHILLAHNPLYFPEYAEWGADLILSGHNHGGWIRLPVFGGVVSPQMRFFPDYDAGLYRQGESQMIISRGLGTHTFPIRVNNYPEISVITLRKLRI